MITRSDGNVVRQSGTLVIGVRHTRFNMSTRLLPWGIDMHHSSKHGIKSHEQPLFEIWRGQVCIETILFAYLRPLSRACLQCACAYTGMGKASPTAAGVQRHTGGARLPKGVREDFYGKHCVRINKNTLATLVG